MIGTIRLAGATHRGRRRDNNEDAFHIDESMCVAILADGMGGQNCGEVGSEITVRVVNEYLKQPEDGLSLEETAMEAIRAANREVIEEAKRRSECDGMGSTIVMALWRLPELVIANVGDSRAYLFRDGELRQLSYDQNFANELRTKLGLSEDRVRTMPNRNVLTMAVGTFEHVLVRTHIEQVRPGDRILLCSDGLHGPVADDIIAGIIGDSISVQEKVDTLIVIANENGGPDNVTAVLLEFGDGTDG
ncbi:MAG TPA: protein phosphatase 2C domain-containing protein [Candidatus Solibacter sp.]|nr:protein phosphatase 2C domain-containing protein [Candidatus Solibacter sp.]